MSKEPPASTAPEKLSKISRPHPSAVTYHIPISPSPSSSLPLKTIVDLPQHSTWTSGLHFHTQHTEYLRLLRGSIYVRLGNKTTLVSRSQEKGDEALVIVVPRGVKHEWMRAEAYVPQSRKSPSGSEDLDAAALAEPVTVEEWTDPSDIGKALFFWNLNGIIMDSSDENTALRRGAKWALGDWWIPFQLFVIFWELDNYPVFYEIWGVGGRRGVLAESIEHAVEYAIAYTMLLTANVLASMIGVEAVSEERTPKDLWEAWRRDRTVERKRD